MIKNVKLFYLKISEKPFAALVKENSPPKKTKQISWKYILFYIFDYCFVFKP